jgi:ferredoxin
MFIIPSFRNETKNEDGIVDFLEQENACFTKKKENTMAYKISEDCTMCGACESSCPTEAISAGDGIYVIAADLCTDCGACESTCPVEAISAG